MQDKKKGKTAKENVANTTFAILQRVQKQLINSSSNIHILEWRLKRKAEKRKSNKKRQQLLKKEELIKN